jgi:regulator of sigma E protease
MMTFIPFIFAIVILVGFHEFGHYIVAKCCGIAVERFSIGFGPILLRKKSSKPLGTEFALSAIPLGGYVKMIDTRTHHDLTVEQTLHAFDRQVLWKRSLVVAAGPIANFLLAWIFLCAIYLSSPMQVKAILDQPKANSIAEISGLVEGDEVRGFAVLPNDSDGVDLDIEYTPIDSWNRLRWKLLKAIMLKEGFVLQVAHADSGDSRVVFDHKEISSLNLKGDVFGQLGLSLDKDKPLPTFELQIGLLESMHRAFERVGDITSVSLYSLWSLVTGASSLNQLSGPIGIAGMAGQSASSGLIAYLGFLALISISLGLMNLLPLPMLDGGQLVFDAIEFIRGKAVSANVREFTSKIGVFGILILTGVAVFNDLSKLFHG